MSKKLSFSIAINLLTENFKKGASAVKSQLKSIQMQVVTFAAALGVGGLGLMGLVSRMKDVARETSRALTALKNVSGGTALFADNLRFLNNLAKQYGIEINTLTMNYAKFKAAGDSVGMTIQDQRKIFEATSRAAVAYGMSAEDTNLTFLALTQMMSKGKISSEELRRQLGERLPIAMAAMAKAAGVPINKLDDLLKKGKLMSAEVLPKFADALNEMIPNVNTDNLETSINRLQNAFTKFTQSSGVQAKYKAIIDGLSSLIESGGKNIQNIMVGIVAAIVFVVMNGATKIWRSYQATGAQIISNAQVANAKMIAATAARVEAEIALDRAKSAAFFATENQRLQAQKAVAKAETTLKQKVAAEKKAIEADTLASSQAAAIKTGSVWATTGAMIKGTFLKLGAAIKSMWNTFAPAIIISAIVAALGYFKNMYDEAKRVKNILSDFKKEASNAGNTQEIKMLQTQLSIMNDKKNSQDKINAAQAALRKMLNLEKGDQRDLNALVGERIKLLKAAAQADFYAQKNVEVEDKITQTAKEGGLSKDQALYLARVGTTKGITYEKYFQSIYKMVGNDIKKAEIAEKALKTITDEYLGIYDYTNKQLESAVNLANKTTKTITPTDDPKPDKTLDKRLEAQRRFERELIQLGLENEASQIAIMRDGREKRIAEINQDYKQRIAAIAKNRDDLIKEYNKSKGLTGTNAVTSTTYKEKLPDVYSAINEAEVNATIEKNSKISELERDLAAELQSIRDNVNSKFKTDLDNQLDEIQAYYTEQVRLQKLSQKEAIELAKKESSLARQNNALKYNDFNTGIAVSKFENQTSGINDPELIERKRTELLKKYALERIEILKWEKTEQSRIETKQLEESIKGYDKTLSKPKTAKGLLNLKMFDKIKQNFIDLGKTEEEAEEKTYEFFDKFNQGGQVAVDVIDEFQGLFGGMNKELDMALNAAKNIAKGFAEGGIIGGVSAAIGQVVSATMGLLSAQKQMDKGTIEGYNNLLETIDIIIDKQKEMLSGLTGKEAIDNVKESIKLLEKQIEASKNIGRDFLGTGQGVFSSSKGKRAFERLKEFRSQINALGLNFDSFGNRIEGIFNLTADELKLLQKELPEAWNALGDETAGYLQNIIDSTEEMENLYEQLKEVQTGINFDSAKDGLKSLILDADATMKDVANNFQDYMRDAIANTIINGQLQTKIRQWYDDFAEAMSDDNLTSQEKERLQEAYNQIYKDAVNMRDNAYEAAGLDFSDSSSTSQSSSRGYSVNMDQDTGGAILGRVTGLHETGLMMKEILSGISMNTTNIFSQNASMNNELKKQTGILDESRQIHIKSYFEIEDMNKTLKSFVSDASDKLNNIDKNTKRL